MESFWPVRRPSRLPAGDAVYWRNAYETLVKQTGRDLNDGLGIDPRSRKAVRQKQEEG